MNNADACRPFCRFGVCPTPDACRADEADNVPTLDTYCASPDCSPSHPCATCTTVPVRAETMAEVVYGSPCACGHSRAAHVNGFGRAADCGFELPDDFCSCNQYREPGAIPAVEIDDASSTDELRDEEAASLEPFDLRDCDSDEWARRTP